MTSEPSHRSMAEPPESPLSPGQISRKNANFSASDILPVLFFGLAIYLLVRSLGILLKTTFLFYHVFGVDNPIQEFKLWRFLLLSILPFGFNLVFGVFFGLKYLDFDRERAEREASGDRVPYRILNPALLVLLLWWGLFNAPLFLTGDSGKQSLFPSWPPDSFYEPIQNYLGLFFFMGNGALGAGFLGVIGWTRLLGRLRTEPG